MPNDDNSNFKEIDNIRHYSFKKMPKTQGNLLWLVERCPLWLAFIMPFIFIAIEILGFACLYMAISSSSFSDGLNYSLFSTLGETVTASVQNSVLINRIISGQLILTNSLISFSMAIVLYKLINIRPELIKMENHLVFDPVSGTLRLRIVNSSKFCLTNAHVDAYFRIHIPNSNRHANAKLQLKVDNMNLLRPYTTWNIATKPFLPDYGSSSTQLDIKRYDKDRIYEFIPDLLNEKYHSDNVGDAKNADYINLNITITIKSPLFGADWVYHKSFRAIDFVCGQLVSLDRHIPNTESIDWSNWEAYDDMSESYCEKCHFRDHCSITKRTQRHTTIK